MSRLCPLSLVLGIVIFATTGRPTCAGERWSRVQSPYFTLHAQCGPAEARAWAVSFGEFCRFATEMLGIPPTQLQPLTIVLFKDRRELKRYHGRAVEEMGHNLGAATSNNELHDLAAMTVTRETGTIIATSLNWDDRSTRQLFYHLGTYWLLSGFKQSGPAWFQTGLAEAFSTFKASDDTIEVGRAPEVEVSFLRENRLMPLEQLFGIKFGELNDRGDTRQRLFQAQSWALVHSLIFGRETTKRDPTQAPMLADFMEALQRGEAADVAFHRVFGTDYAGMLQRLEAYVASGRYALFTLKFDPRAISAELKASDEDAALREVNLGYACLAGLWPEEARRHFLAALAMPGGELPAEENLGEMAMLEKNDLEARAHYERAVALGSRDFHAYYFLGDEAVRDATGGEDKLPRVEPKQARQAATRFEQAINRYPKFVPSYERLALLMPSLATFSEDDRQFLALGVQMAPGNELIQAGLGVWELNNNHADQGRARLERLRANKASGWARLIAEEVTRGQAANHGLAEARKLMDAEKTQEAGELVEKLLQDSSDDSLRASLTTLQEEIGQLDLVLQAEKLAGDREWEAAAAIARSALESRLPAPLQLRAQAVLARTQAKK